MKICSSKSEQILNKLADLYIEITNNYMKKNRAAKMCLLREYSNVNYLCKEIPVINSYEDAKEYEDAYYKYFVYCETRVTQAIDLIETINRELENFYESCTSKS